MYVCDFILSKYSEFVFFSVDVSKDYNAKKKNNDSCNWINSNKITLLPKIWKEFKRINKDITFASSINLKLQLPPDSHLWIVHAVVGILTNQRLHWKSARQHKRKLGAIHRN